MKQSDKKEQKMKIIKILTENVEIVNRLDNSNMKSKTQTYDIRDHD